MSPWVVLCLILALKSAQTSWVIQKSPDGGYSKILVAIHSSVPEDPNLIQRIKNLFTEASPILCKATKGTYFRSVSISVPNTWRPSTSYGNATEDQFSLAHFRVEAPSLKHGDEPYTLQPEGCGKPGLYTHFTPEYLRKPESNWPSKANEKPEMRLVQEWAHLRYGLFDEFGYPGHKDYPNFYYDENKILNPTRCTADIKGSPEIDCAVNIPEGEVDKFDVVNCSFVPINEYADNAASIMFTASVPGVEHFCDDSGDHAHNSKAPNKHNQMCNGRSAWNVLKDHPDFNSEQAKRLMRSFSTNQRDCSNTPTFNVFRVPGVTDGRLVLVLDTSGSMKGRPLELLRTAASRAIQDHIPEGSRLGIVSFSTSPKTLAELTLVDNNSRGQLIQLLPKVDDQGYTAIGQGLLRGLDVLNPKGRSQGGRIILITDGEENVGPRVDDVTKALKMAGVEVIGIAFGVKATETLERLVNATGGKVFLFGDLKGKKPTSALDSAFFEATTIQTTEEFQPVKIVDENLSLNQQWTERQILVEEILGKNLVVTLTSPDIKNVQMTLIDPNGESLGPESTLYDKDDVLKRIKVTIPKANNGTWRLSLRSSYGRTTVSLTVWSYPQDSGSIQNTPRPLRIRAWVDNLQPRYPSAVRILAQITQGRQIDEKRFSVVATVHGPLAGKKSIDIVLQDNGADPDVTKGDGVYSGYFTQYTDNGRYAVVVRMLEVANTTKNGQGLTRMRRSAYVEGRIERVVDAGSFRLEGFEKKDMISPSRVTDLLARVDREHRYRIWMTWTASGNDMNHGRASRIELRMAHDPDVLRHNFSTCELVNHWFIGDVVIQAGGQTQQAELKIPSVYGNTSDNVTVFLFALRATDASGNTAEISNIASATFLPVSDKSSALPLKEERSILVPLVAGACALLLLIALAGLLLMVITKRKEQKTKTHYFEIPAAEMKDRETYNYNC